MGCHPSRHLFFGGCSPGLVDTGCRIGRRSVGQRLIRSTSPVASSRSRAVATASWENLTSSRSLSRARPSFYWPPLPMHCTQSSFAVITAQPRSGSLYAPAHLLAHSCLVLRRSVSTTHKLSHSRVTHHDVGDFTLPPPSRLRTCLHVLLAIAVVPATVLTHLGRAGHSLGGAGRLLASHDSAGLLTSAPTHLYLFVPLLQACHALLHPGHALADLQLTRFTPRSRHKLSRSRPNIAKCPLATPRFTRSLSLQS